MVKQKISIYRILSKNKVSSKMIVLILRELKGKMSLNYKTKLALTLILILILINALTNVDDA